jgi:uncharacterized protein YkwD
MNAKHRSRRNVLVIGAGLGAGIALSGCTSVLPDSGISSHAGRRTNSSARPLNFVPAAGLQAVNATRRKYLLQAFQHDSRLQRAAQNHADYMARTGKFGHEFGPGTYFPERIAAVGFDGSAGENLGVGYGSVDEAIQGWLNSPKHRKIMLRAKYDRAGIAYAFNRSGKNSRYTHFWVLVVGQTAPSGMRLGPYVRRS